MNPNFAINAEADPDTLARDVSRVFSESARTRLAVCDIDGSWPADLWKLSIDTGFHTIFMPAAKGQIDLARIVCAMDALGESTSDTGFALAVVAHALGCALPIHLSRTRGLPATLLADLQSGRRIGACAMTEEGAGSDAFAMATRATQTSDGYSLDGTKLYITNGPVADLFLVYARTNDTLGALGISCFLIERGTRNLEIVPGPAKLGVRAAQWSSLRLTACQVPASARIGAEGAGAALFRESMKWERIALSAATLGAMRASLDRCTAFARRRTRRGKPLAAFDVIAERLVEMRMRVATADALVADVVRSQRNGSPIDERVAIAKLLVGRLAIRNGEEEIGLMGADGIALETGASMLMRNALALQSASGPADVQRRIVAVAMGLR